ncbi:MAG: class I SAM-dependent methyltransferase [Acidobacteria bacterium]|nr:class I SAM-dependent methyltransferase [Acidobacteriota bacterium]
MNQPRAYNSGDATYHDRHSRRTLARARTIERHLGAAKTLLDVGCNRGLTSAHLLAAGVVDRVTGLELQRSTLAPDLLADPRFEFIEGNVCDIELTTSFDAVFYGAVHHHIVRERGLGEAIRVLRQLTSHCGQVMFFESGHITEGGRWPWQRVIRRYFRTDEEHLSYLLRSVEDQIRSFEVLGRFRIHGVSRWLLRLDLLPGSERLKPLAGAPIIELDGYRRTRFVRSFGSYRQDLKPATAEATDSPVELSVAHHPKKPTLFLKRARFAPGALHQEYLQGRVLSRPWAVKPLGRSTEGDLVFPWADGDKLCEVSSRPAATRAAVADDLLRLISEAARTPALQVRRLIAPPGPQASLVDVVDFNPNNLLVEDKNGVPMVRMVDFEIQSNHYRWRNRLHLARALETLGQHRPRAWRERLLGTLSGIRHLLRYQLAPIEVRLRDRQPSFASLAVAEANSLLGHCLARLLPRHHDF